MRRGRQKSALSISEEERAQLLSILRARSLPSALTQRARIVLACEQEPSNKAVAADLDVGAHTVGKWRNRFITHRLEGLYDELRSGRPSNATITRPHPSDGPQPQIPSSKKSPDFVTVSLGQNTRKAQRSAQLGTMPGQVHPRTNGHRIPSVTRKVRPSLWKPIG
jgi:hypothetical protein